MVQNKILVLNIIGLKYSDCKKQYGIKNIVKTLRFEIFSMLRA